MSEAGLTKIATEALKPVSTFIDALLGPKLQRIRNWAEKQELGLVITVGSCVAAASSKGGGSYAIMYGLMLIGGGDFLYGLVGWLGELKKE